MTPHHVAKRLTLGHWWLNSCSSAEHHQHRLDAALRDADEGYNRCPTCDFANFKRLARCSLCGDRVSLSAAFVDSLVRSASTASTRSCRSATTASTTSNNSSRRGSKNVTFALPSVLPEPVSAVAAETSTRPDDDVRVRLELSERQLRAMYVSSSGLDSSGCGRLSTQSLQPLTNTHAPPYSKRKEWTRKLDVKGAVFWYRDSCADVADVRFPGFTARFEPKRRRTALWTTDDVDIDALSVSPTAPGSVTDSASEMSLSLSTPRLQQQLSFSNETSDASVKALAGGATLMLTLQQRALELEHDTLPVEIRLTDASVVDAARFPLYCDRANPALTWKEVLRIASRSFPTKYAHFATSAAALSSFAAKQSVEVRVRRSALIADSVAALSAIPAADIRSPLHVSYVDEHIDDTSELASSGTRASHREWFVALSEQLVAPRQGVFRCVDAATRTFYVNADSRYALGEHHLAHVFAAGRFIGRALLDGHALSFRLALPLRKLLLGVPVTFPDLESYDSALFARLVYLSTTLDVEALGLDFSVAEPRGDALVTVDLVRNGCTIDVTDDNKDFYLERRFMHELFERVAHQLFAFLKGFYEVIPQELLMLFDPAELDLLLSGPDELDVDDWVTHTRYSPELALHPVGKWFWELVRALPTDEHRRRLLRFATGSTQAPVAGFAVLADADGRACTFELRGVGLRDFKDGPPHLHAHPTRNRIDVPLFQRREQLQEALGAIVGV